MKILKIADMAGVYPKESGLSYRLFFSWGEYADVKLPHAIRFKIRVGDKEYTVNMDQMICPAGVPAKEWRKILQYIEINRQTIQSFWDGKLTDKEFHNRLVLLARAGRPHPFRGGDESEQDQTRRVDV